MRFTPVPPYETEPAINAICESYRRTIALETVEPLLVIPTFICDFLCIHPFNDGNGRMSRLLTLLLLYQNGYVVGKYISIEKQIETTKDAYYDALQDSDIGWNEAANDPTPFIKYMLRMILTCYVEFEQRITMTGSGSTSTALDVVRSYALEKLGKFTGADVIAGCPSYGRTAILNAIKKLVEEGTIIKMGNGRNTYYVRKDSLEN